MAEAFEEVQTFGTQSPAPFSRWQSLYDTFIYRTPVERAARVLLRGLAPAEVAETSTEMPDFQQAADCYLHNKSLIEHFCHRLGVLPVFVWQPVPGYKYDLEHHLFVAPDAYQKPRQFYQLMASRLREDRDGEFGPNFLWCADLQEHETECLYVDNHHYTASFTAKLADQIVEMCRERALLQEAGLLME